MLLVTQHLDLGCCSELHGLGGSGGTTVSISLGSFIGANSIKASPAPSLLGAGS